MHPILADFHSALQKITSDTPNLSIGGGGLLLIIIAIMVNKKILKFALMLLGVAALVGAVIWHLNKQQ